ncbi:MAG: type I pullulanase [Longicatena sp.]
MRQQKYYEAYFDDFDKIIVFMSKNSYDGVSNKFYLKDTFGNICDLHIQSIETTPNNYNKYTLNLYDQIEIGNEYYVVHQHARAVCLQYSGIVKTEKFDEMFFYEGKDLGYTYNHTKTSFALWAPTAFRVKLEVEKNGMINTYEMQRSEYGVFRYSVLDNLENATYVYFVRVNGEWKESIDPYGIASIENSRRSAIIDVDKVTIKDYPLPEMKSACDAIIYETSVRDFTINKYCGVEYGGKFSGFVEENETTKEFNTGFTYLKSLGITHVQLMPVLDFGSVDEQYPFMHYNWGYDPVQYRVLDGSFSVDATNPYERIFSFIKLIEKCHEANIRVNLDVVFNHVYDKETSSFENIVPNYYFQMNDQGDFSNGTYCGNDIDTTRKMCSKFIVDTCVFLTKMYHIDGMRFDLMGILDTHTMNMVYQKCCALNPDFMVYGEGWDMPSFLDSQQRASIANHMKMPHIAHFSDRFRDVAKGRTSTNEVNIKGYCTGAIYLLDIMKNCLSASCTNVGMEPMFLSPIQAVNYVECHDNMTAWDKIKVCCKDESKDTRVAIHKMLNAACLLAQGIPFIHSGQEFARSKHGLANTYEEGDDINQIAYQRRTQYQEIVESTKDLIQMRKKYACLRYSTKEEIEKYVTFEDIEQSVLVYRMKDETEEMMVFFNPTQTHYCYELHEEYQLLYNQKGIKDKKISKVEIAPYRTIVVYKKLADE